jgi:hypothetical protein
LQVLQRILNARQFGLKLIANVTYGYTAAGFSGRMPCAELADSIVQVTTASTTTSFSGWDIAFHLLPEKRCSLLSKSDAALPCHHHNSRM